MFSDPSGRPDPPSWRSTSALSSLCALPLGSRVSLCPLRAVQPSTAQPSSARPIATCPLPPSVSPPMTTRTPRSVLKATLSTWRSALNHRERGKRTPERAFMWIKYQDEGWFWCLPSVRLIRVLHQCPVRSLPRPRSVTSAGLSTRRWMMSRGASRSDSGEPPWEARPPPVTANGRVRCGTAGVRCPRATRRALERASSALLTARS